MRLAVSQEMKNISKTIVILSRAEFRIVLATCIGRGSVTWTYDCGVCSNLIQHAVEGVWLDVEKLLFRHYRVTDSTYMPSTQIQLPFSALYEDCALPRLA